MFFWFLLKQNHFSFVPNSHSKTKVATIKNGANQLAFLSRLLYKSSVVFQFQTSARRLYFHKSQTYIFLNNSVFGVILIFVCSCINCHKDTSRACICDIIANGCSNLRMIKTLYHTLRIHIHTFSWRHLILNVFSWAMDELWFFFPWTLWTRILE